MYCSVDNNRKRYLISDDIDGLSCEAEKVFQIEDDTPNGLLRKAKRIKKLGFDVCINLIDFFYETE